MRSSFLRIDRKFRKLRKDRKDQMNKAGDVDSPGKWYFSI